MFIGFETTKAKPLLEAALAGRNLRNQLINSNIANISTPFYKAKDVDFETALVREADRIYNKFDDKILRLAKTHKNHLCPADFDNKSSGTIYLRDGHLARNDANTVDLDVETSELSKNAIMINAIDTALNKSGAIFKSVIEANSKL